VKHEDDTDRPLDEHVDAAKTKLGEVKERATSSATDAQEKGKAHALDVASAQQPGEVAEEKKQGMMDRMRHFRVCPLSTLQCCGDIQSILSRMDEVTAFHKNIRTRCRKSLIAPSTSSLRNTSLKNAEINSSSASRKSAYFAHLLYMTI
jgi:hypothetical protein